MACMSVCVRVCVFSTGSFDRFKVLTGTAGSACARVRGASLKDGTSGRRGECIRGVSGTSRDRQGPEGSRKQWRLLEAAFTKVPGGLAWPSGVERGSRSGEHVRGSLSLATRATPAVAVCCRNAPGKHSGTGGAGAVRGLSGFGLILSCGGTRNPQWPAEDRRQEAQSWSRNCGGGGRRDRDGGTCHQTASGPARVTQDPSTEPFRGAPESPMLPPGEIRFMS